MAHGTPITLTLYDPETCEARETFSRAFVPWGILKAAIRCQGMDQKAMTPEDVDLINGLVVDFYNNQFTVEDLKAGATLGEVMSVLTAIMSRLEGDLPGLGGANPTLPGRQNSKKLSPKVTPRKKTDT
jgi:hypothetical protein